MRITYETLGALIALMNKDQMQSDVTVEIPTEGCCECYAAELRIAGESHDGGLDDGHPVLFVHQLELGGEKRMTDVSVISQMIGLEPSDAKSDTYWNGAIDALHSQGFGATEICDMVCNMGCDRDTAVGLCGTDE